MAVTLVLAILAMLGALNEWVLLGLTVVNGYRKRHLEWAQVVSVQLPPGAPWPSLDLDDGTTISAMGIAGFSSILQVYRERAPLRRNVDLAEVADAAVFLLGPASRAITELKALLSQR